MTTVTEWEDEALMTIRAVARATSFSPGFLCELFDQRVLPGTFVASGERIHRRIPRSFVADWFAAVHFGGEVVDLRDFASRWKAEQAERKAA